MLPLRALFQALRWRALICWLCIALSSGIPAVAESHGDTTGKSWHAPKSCIFIRNPVPATRASISKGEQIYKARCIGCHGSSGHGDGPDASQLRVHPARLSGERVQEQTDGLLWWKITFGKRPMPGYGFRLSSTDRWHVINYLRTLAENKPQR